MKRIKPVYLFISSLTFLLWSSSPVAAITWFYATWDESVETIVDETNIVKDEYNVTGYNSDYATGTLPVLMPYSDFIEVDAGASGSSSASWGAADYRATMAIDFQTDGSGMNISNTINAYGSASAGEYDTTGEWVADANAYYRAWTGAEFDLDGQYDYLFEASVDHYFSSFTYGIYDWIADDYLFRETVYGTPGEGSEVSVGGSLAKGEYQFRLFIDGQAYNYPSGSYMSGNFGFSLTPSAVPVPAAVWMLGSGLLCFVGIGRRAHRRTITGMHTHESR